MSKKLKATELFLSLGLAATLVAGCGAPEEGGEAVESGADTEEVEGTGTGTGTESPEVEDSEGGEGGEG